MTRRSPMAELLDRIRAGQERAENVRDRAHQLRPRPRPPEPTVGERADSVLRTQLPRLSGGHRKH